MGAGHHVPPAHAWSSPDTGSPGGASAGHMAEVPAAGRGAAHTLPGSPVAMEPAPIRGSCCPMPAQESHFLPSAQGRGPTQSTSRRGRGSGVLCRGDTGVLCGSGWRPEEHQVLGRGLSEPSRHRSCGSRAWPRRLVGKLEVWRQQRHPCPRAPAGGKPARQVRSAQARGGWTAARSHARAPRSRVSSGPGPPLTVTPRPTPQPGSRLGRSIALEI